MGIFDFLDSIFSTNINISEIDKINIMPKNELTTKEIEENIIYFNPHWSTRFCKKCHKHIIGDRFVLNFYEFGDNISFEDKPSPYIGKTLQICLKCTDNIVECAKYMLDIINNKTNEKEKEMKILETLNLEKERLEKQLSEFNNVKLPENMPTHILEHLKMKKSLIENCIKSIEDLENNYKLDETIKKLFSS